MAVEFCPHCQQPMAHVRAGVRLTPLKTRIFDLIKSRPGISRKEICWQVYDTVSEAKERTIAAHVVQIRDKFESTDLDIEGVSFEGYKFVKRGKRRARNNPPPPGKGRHARTQPR